MSSRRSSNRRISFSQQSANRYRESVAETAPLELSRTRSHEISVAESIAIQEVPDADLKHDTDGDEEEVVEVIWPHSVRYLILLCAVLTSLSFGVTQVPLLYVFRLMTCDAYYESHTEPPINQFAESSQTGLADAIISYILTPLSQSIGSTTDSTYDRCSVRAIESSTALNISLVGASTTIFGIANLFVTGSLIKSIGLKRALLINVGFPAVRLLIQNIGVEVWGTTGIIIVQCSQIATVLGGPSGYLLVLNAFMTEVVEYEARTAALGRVAGSMMFGSAMGFLLGGLIAEDFGIKAPFRLTLALFLLAALYVAVFLPYVPPTKTKVDVGITQHSSKSRFQRFFGPLLVFAPKKFITKAGTIQTEFGTFLLACGVFLGILATGYLPTLLQLYSTDVFKFGTKANGWLIFMYSFLRGCFLTFAFPKLISVGRRLTMRHEMNDNDTPDNNASGESERDPLLPQPPESANSESHKLPQKDQTFTFDLIYTRFSLLADGLLTLLCAFVQEGWQMYLVAAVLPFAAGTGSAAKGTVLQMVGSHATSEERTDALAGLSLVENMARLSTTFVFGVIFAAFASIGRTDLVFTCNAAVAIFGFLVLFFARFPTEGSIRLDKADADESDI